MKKIASLVAVATLSMASASVFAAANANDCSEVPDHATLQAALATATAADLGGLNFDMWGTVVNRYGVVCAVAKAFSPSNLTGGNTGDSTNADPWLGSRAISAQKANTAVAYSTNFLALSTANLYSAVQPGGSLFGLQHSNPVDPRVAFRGNPANYGASNDPMVGLKVGGVNVFGGGLALYNTAGELVGAVGVSGDTSCADHNVAWMTREELPGFGVANLDAGGALFGGLKGWSAGFSDAKNDNIIYDIVADSNGVKSSPSGFGHPACEVGFTQMENTISDQFNSADITSVSDLAARPTDGSDLWPLAPANP
ncbi:MAG: heme-binding protein [Methylococcaceae bacterium]|nr:heme-binding protein [Methylococcaceae bacterium]